MKHIERTSPRAAFTIVELLVVVSLLAILFVLILPAVNSVRDSGQRVACAQRQTTLALAMASHNLRQERLPEAQSILDLTSLSFPSLYTQRVVTWQVMLLPYLERNDIFVDLVADRGWNDMGVRGQQYWLDDLTCPSSVPSVKLYSLIHYFANCGTGLARDDGVLVGTAYAPSGLPSPFPSPRPPYPPRGPGPPAMSLDTIEDRDGLSNTLLIAEMTRSIGSVYVEWNRDVNCNPLNPPVQDKSVFGWPVPFAFRNGSPFFGMPSDTPPSVVVNNSSASYTPFSRHSGGANVAFCDGHVRFLKDSLPGYLYAHMVTSRSVSNGTTGTTPYDANSSRANTWLRASPAPVPYTFVPGDLD